MKTEAKTGCFGTQPLKTYLYKRKENDKRWAGNPIDRPIE